jgi:tetratricopeptide (TPR) repeat protein
MPEFDSQFLERRRFLVQCAQATGAFFIAACPARPSADPELHLHPHYREQTPLDAALPKINPALDGFLTEQYHDKIAAILETWTAGLLHSPLSLQPVEEHLDANFVGSPWQPVDSHPLHASLATLELRRLNFAQPSLTPAPFMAELGSTLSGFSKILTADFQITGISGQTTQVRYELVGTGSGFYREQRTGVWSLEWSANRLVRWKAHDEVRVRAKQPSYTEITQAAFGANPSYEAQMLQGADHWRSILDGACGIDIYGHNGVSVGDIDGDGLDDIYICQPAGLPNRLYRNRGDGTFEDITESSGLGLLDNTACALFADFDNDGRQDIVVVRATGPLLFHNQGNGKFILKPDAFHFATPLQGTFTGAAAADYNRDGLLDIYFCLYTYYQGADQYKYPTPYFAAENGPPNFLMRNNGDGTFSDVTSQTGLDKNNTRFSFCCGWSDYNQDGWPDLYVVNDFGRKNLYRNNGDGTFTDVAAEAGVEDVGAGMSVSWLDEKNLYVGNMWTAAGERLTSDENFQPQASTQVKTLYKKHAMGNSLFVRENLNNFRDATAESQTGVGRWAWSSDAWDFDHDGFADIYVTNGMISGTERPDLNSFFWRQVVAKSPNTAASSSDYEQGWNAINELIRSGYSWSGFERNVLFANNQDGTFTDVSAALGLDFIEDSRSFALADLDGDGRQEILIKNRNAPQLRLLKNTLPALPPCISFRLRGTKSNRDAIGTSVTIGSQTRFLQAGSGFLSQHSKNLFFGLGESKGNVSATIRWPSGLVQHLTDLPPNHQITVVEGSNPAHAPFRKGEAVTSVAARVTQATQTQTWLLTPIPAPTKTSSLITIDSNQDQDVSAIYNLLFRSIYDNHRDMPLPTSFLTHQGQIVKVYQGPVDAKAVEKDLKEIPASDSERLSKALPFPGDATTYTFGRNYLSLGSIFFQRGYLDPSEIYFQSALKEDPGSAEALYGLGSIYLKQQKDEQAQASFERATQLKASYPETTPNAWNNLGLLATRQGQTAKAIGYFEQALALNPNHFIALENLGSAYRQQKRWHPARTTLERALAIKPDDPEANYSLGMVFAQTDDTAKAYEYLGKALQARPAYPEALNNLGVLYLRTRRRDEAVATFEKCIQLAPAFDQSYMNLARVYAIEGDPEKARTVLRALLSQHPDHAMAKQALGELNSK